MPNKITLDVTFKITVDLEKWADTYGLAHTTTAREDAEADARDYVPTLVRDAVSRQLAVGDFPHTLTLEA